MLITAPPEADIVSKLKEKNIYAAVIGKITEKELKLIRKNETIKIIPPERDELYVVIEKNSKK
jgi:hydrogenase expression/formation protein HypE